VSNGWVSLNEKRSCPSIFLEGLKKATKTYEDNMTTGCESNSAYQNRSANQ
jgi:hypothetical protein